MENYLATLVSKFKRLRMQYLRFKYRHFLVAGKNFTCGRGTYLYAKHRIVIGDNVYCGRYCTIECDAEIGSEVLIANNVALIGRLDHDYRKIGVPIRSAPAIRHNEYNPEPKKTMITIGDDVWIGFGSIILSGVTIGEGAIIGAGSLVIRDVEPFSIIGGSPAHKLGMRFSEEEIMLHKEKCRGKYNCYKK